MRGILEECLLGKYRQCSKGEGVILIAEGLDFDFLATRSCTDRLMLFVAVDSNTRYAESEPG